MTPTQAKQLCIQAHKGQFRKDGTTPYSSHPIAVADMMTTNDEKIVAYLHDIIENTPITIANLLHNGLSHTLVISLERLTKFEGESYMGYLRVIAECPLATKVKLADMFHNISEESSDKQKAKYFAGIKYLLSTL